MILALRTVLLFGLIWATTSFGFAALALTTLFGQPSYIDPSQVYAVTVVSCVATVVGLGLAVLISLRLTGRETFAECGSSRALMIVAVCFLGITAWSFLASPPVDQQHFFVRFLSGARFEFLMIAVAAVVVAFRKA